MTYKDSNTHNSSPAAEPLALRLSEGLGAVSEAPCPTPDRCRIQATGPSMSTLMYYEPIYDGHGNNLNPDQNTHYRPRKCATCGREWSA